MENYSCQMSKLVIIIIFSFLLINVIVIVVDLDFSSKQIQLIELEIKENVPERWNWISMIIELNRIDRKDINCHLLEENEVFTNSIRKQLTMNIGQTTYLFCSERFISTKEKKRNFLLLNWDLQWSRRTNLFRCRISFLQSLMWKLNETLLLFY